MSGKKCNNPTCNGAFCQGSRPGTIRACPVCNVPNESTRSQDMSQPEHEGPFSFCVSSGEVRGPLGIFNSMGGLVPYDRLNQVWHSRDAELEAKDAWIKEMGIVALSRARLNDELLMKNRLLVEEKKNVELALTSICEWVEEHNQSKTLFVLEQAKKALGGEG